MHTDTEGRAAIFALKCTVSHNKVRESAFLHLQLLHLCYSTVSLGRNGMDSASSEQRQVHWVASFRTP